MNMINPFEQPGRWYKAAFHIHSTTSDGARSPRDMVDWYRRLGYQVVVLTDHFKTNDITGMSRRNFLVISGMEYHPPVPGSKTDLHHLVAVNVPKGFEFSPAVRKNANACIRAVKAAGGESFLAHPYWCHHRYDQYAYIKGYAAIEVYNSTCDHIGRADTECDWSQLLDAGRMVPALAVDDTHGDADTTGRSCTWLKLPELTPEAVLQALRTGCGYSSNGPVIEDFRIENGAIVLSCSPAAAVYFVVHNAVTGAAHYAGAQPLRSVRRELPSDWKCFRAVVVDGSGRKAWSNPIILEPGDRVQARREQAARNREALRSSYALAKQAGHRGWQPLDLSPVVNRALTGRDSGFGPGHELRHLAAGAKTIHGVPFRLLDPRKHGNLAAVALPSARLPNPAGGRAARAVIVPAAGRFRAVYLLHGAGYVSEHRQIAEYQFVYEDGRIERMPIRGLGPASNRKAEMQGRMDVCRIQDWWPAQTQFDQPQAHRLPVASPKDPCDVRYLYTTEWINPRPSVPLREVRLAADSKSGAIVLVLAATGLV
jgi:hypothetical protein